jgi:Tol biopolymer transport system component/predicted Ser/Thr protein kinase
VSDLRRWPHADQLLDEALARPRHERSAFVRRAAGEDADLASALEAVLLEVEEADGFLTPGGALNGEVGQDVREMLADVPSPPVMEPGTRIEQYEVVGLIGRGGMGEVYRARDLRLQRDVALKVLPHAFARDEDRRARFRREARVLAMLSHPGIGAIHGVAESDEVDALVLELVEGPTLDERLRQGPLPVADVLTISRHLVDAVAAAHTRGILHRDLKPANIKVLPDGTIKVLDFGLAKALTPEPSVLDANLSAAAPHVLLGTAAYMSPEQVRGQRVDARADIWACGCIIFEMLTGTRAFSGDTVPEILARVVEREPAFSLLPAGTPPALRRLLRRTLEKDPSRRLGYIGDARLELDDAVSDEAVEAPPPARLGAGVLAAALVGALMVGGAVGAIVVGRSSTAPPATASWFTISLGTGEAPVTGFQPMLALSPDGRTMVYRARKDGITRLYRRALDRLEAMPIAGTEEGTGPFFSPDGRWLGFDSDGVLKRVALAGGLPVEIGAAPGGVTADWLPDDTIVYATNTSRTLQRVPASGGPPEAITSLDAARGDTLHLLPQALADGRRLLFTIVAGRARHIAVLDLQSREVRVITDGSNGRLATDRTLVFARDGVLWSVPVDPSSLALTGVAAPVIEGIEHTDNTVLHFAASAEGSIAYLPAGQNLPGLQRLVWLDRAGRETPAGLDPGPFTRVSLSPDGTRLALAMTDRGNTDIWVADPERRTMSRLTIEPTIEAMPTWSPDGRVAFRSEREGPGIFQRAWQGAGPVERVTTTDGPIHSPYSWTPDGKTLLLALFRSFNRQAIASVTPPDPTVRVLLDGDYAQLDPNVSPDGRWMAYQSDETGRFEVYVRPYPEVGRGRWRVSTNGGTSPRWSRDGAEMFYYDGSGLISVPVRTTGESLTMGRPSTLFQVVVFGGRLGPDYEIGPDGRFLFIVPGPPAVARDSHVVYVQHWSR